MSKVPDPKDGKLTFRHIHIATSACTLTPLILLTFQHYTCIDVHQYSQSNGGLQDTKRVHRGCTEGAQSAGDNMARAMQGFTDKMISGLKAKDTKYRVREGRGFAVRVMPSGVKTFVFLYTHKSLRKEMTLGNYPHVPLKEARQKYQDAYSLAERGIDPQENNKAIAKAKEKEANDSFGYFAKEYIEWSEKNHSTAWHKTVRLSLNNDVIPMWKDKPISSIKRKDAIALLEQKAAHAPGQAKNVHKAVRGVFEHAISRDCDIVNPCLRLTKAVPDLKPVMKKRILSDTELKTIWQAIDQGTGDERTKAALKLVLVTAQRPAEITNMHRSQIEGNWWTLQHDTVKNKETHRVYLTSTALQLIGDNEGYIFPSYKVGDNGEPRPIVRQTLSQSIVGHCYYGILPSWTPHDLRRTARTIMSRLKVPLEYAEAVLNHKKQGVRAVYDLHDYDDEKREALLTLETGLLKIVADNRSATEDTTQKGE